MGGHQAQMGVFRLSLNNQKITGNFEVVSSSGLTLILSYNSKIIGTINSSQTAAKLSITVDSTSSIELTGDSAYTSLIAENFENLINGSYSWNETEEKAINRTQGGGGDRPGHQDGHDPREGGPSSSKSSNIKWNKLIIGLFILLLIV